MSKSTLNSTLAIVGKVVGRCTQMLVDTGSAVTLVREDVWREATQPVTDDLTEPVRPIVAANGGEMELLGKKEL